MSKTTITLLALGLLLTYFIAVGLFYGWAAAGASGVLLVVVPFFVRWAGYRVIYRLAANNRGVTLMREGTAKVIMRAGSYHKILIQWRGHGIDDDGNVTDTPPAPTWLSRLLGGLQYYGSPIIEANQVYVHTFQAPMVTGNGSLAEVNNRTDCVELPDATYWVRMEKVEDKNRIPLDVEITFVGRVVNVYKFLFAVSNVFATISARMLGQGRDVVTHETYEDWIARPVDMGKQIAKKLRTDIAEIQKNYGFEIQKGSIQVRSINPDSAYRQLTTKVREAEVNTQEEQEKARIPALKATALVLEPLARARGQSVDELTADLKTDKDLQKQVLDQVNELIRLQMTIDGKSYQKIETANALMDLVVAVRSALRT